MQKWEHACRLQRCKHACTSQMIMHLVTFHPLLRLSVKFTVEGYPNLSDLANLLSMLLLKSFSDLCPAELVCLRRGNMTTYTHNLHLLYFAVCKNKGACTVKYKYFPKGSFEKIFDCLKIHQWLIHRLRLVAHINIIQVSPPAGRSEIQDLHFKSRICTKTTQMIYW